MRRAVLLLFLLGCDAPPAPPPQEVEKTAPKKEPEPEADPEPVIVEGAPFTIDDLRELGFPKSLVLVRAGSPEQNRFTVTGHKHAIYLWIEWRSGASDKDYETQRAETPGAADENRYGSRSYVVRVNNPREDMVAARRVEIGFMKGEMLAVVKASNSDQEVIEHDLERVARGAAEKLHSKLK